MSDPLDFTRTAAAIEAYDAADAAFHPDTMSLDDADAGYAQLEKLAEAVGYAFGLDTADRNNPEDCRRLIRPGHKVPAPGFEESFVRRAVAKWKERNANP